MKRSTQALLMLLVAAGLVGCTCPTWRYGRRDFDRGDFDRVEPGMSRCQVLQTLGRPTDVSKSVMHWQLGSCTDAWVFFSAGGRRVTGKYWQDREGLRLDETRPVRD